MTGELFIVVCEPVAEADGYSDIWKVEICDMRNSLTGQLPREEVAEFVADQIDQMMEWATEHE